MTYLAVDRSNHGGKPYEIFVGVYSKERIDITEKLFDMKLERGKLPVHVLLGGREYRHVIIPEDARLALGANVTSLMAIGELTKHFERKAEGLKAVLVNGELDTKIIEEIKRLTKHSHPEVLGVPQGDERFPLINVADSVAYALLKCYRNPDGRYDPTKFELKPHIRNYEEAIRRLRKEQIINGQSKGFVNNTRHRAARVARIKSRLSR